MGGTLLKTVVIYTGVHNWKKKRFFKILREETVREEQMDWKCQWREEWDIRNLNSFLRGMWERSERDRPLLKMQMKGIKPMIKWKDLDELSEVRCEVVRDSETSSPKHREQWQNMVEIALIFFPRNPSFFICFLITVKNTSILSVTQAHNPNVTDD